MPAKTDPTLRGMLRRELGRLGLTDPQITALLPVRLPGPDKPGFERPDDYEWGRVALAPGVRGGFTNAVRRLWKDTPPDREQIEVIVRLMEDGFTAGDSMLVLRSALSLDDILPFTWRWRDDGMRRCVLYADSLRHAGRTLNDFLDVIWHNQGDRSVIRRTALCVMLVGRLPDYAALKHEWQRWTDAAMTDETIRDFDEDLLRRMRKFYKIASPQKAFAYYCARIPIPEAVEFEADPSVDETAVEMLAALKGMGMV